MKNDEEKSIITYLTVENKWTQKSEENGINYEEKYITLNKKKIFTRYLVSSHSIGSFVIFHGCGESTNDYGHIASLLFSYGFNVFMMDQEGHGKSKDSEPHPFVKDYTYMIDNGIAYITWLENVFALSKIPLFLLGQAMGATTILHMLKTEKLKCSINGVILLSPAFEMVNAPSSLVQMGFSVVSTLTGNWWGTGERLVLDPAEYSDVKEVQEYISKDKLRNYSISGHLGYSIIKMGADALEYGPKLHCPILIVQGAKDTITKLSATKTFVESLSNCKSKTYVEFETGSHSLLYSTCIWELEYFLISWIEKRMDEVSPNQEIQKSILKQFEKVNLQLQQNTELVAKLEKENERMTLRWDEFLRNSSDSKLIDEKLAKENLELTKRLKEKQTQILNMLDQQGESKDHLTVPQPQPDPTISKPQLIEPFLNQIVGFDSTKLKPVQKMEKIQLLHPIQVKFLKAISNQRDDGSLNFIGDERDEKGGWESK